MQALFDEQQSLSSTLKEQLNAARAELSSATERESEMKSQLALQQARLRSLKA